MISDVILKYIGRIWGFSLGAALVFLGAACAGQIDPPTATPAAPPSAPPTASPGAPALTATPFPTASPTPSCSTAEGSLDRRTYEGVVVNGAIPYLIYLPDCLTAGDGPLPVLYFFHGKPFDENHWIELGTIEAYQRGVQAGGWGEAVLVFAYLPEPVFSETDGGPGSYEQEFLEGLVPAVEGQVPAGGAPNRRMLIGISRGGIWTLEIGLSDPARAARIAAFSPSLAVNYPRPAYDPFQLARSGARASISIFLLAGDRDWARRETERLAATMAETGHSPELVIVPGDHSAATWQVGLDPLFEFLLGAGEGTS